MSSKKCNSYVCRMISRKLRRGMQVTSLPAMEPKRGKGEIPEMQSMTMSWPSLIAPDIIVYNQNQQAKTGEPPPPATSLMLSPTRGKPWHHISGEGIGVNKHKYLATTDPDGEPTKHIHEHHHYECTQKPRELPKVTRTGYFMIRPMNPEDKAPAPPRPNFNRFHNMFLPRNNRRSFENGFYFQCNTPFYNYPYFGNPNGIYQNQGYIYSNAPAGGQHHHFHQHFYHSQYNQYPTLNYHPPRVRFLPHQQASMQFNQNTQHFRHFDHNDSQLWSDRSEYNGRPIVKLY